MHPCSSISISVLLMTLILGIPTAVCGQSPPSGFDRDRGRTMLSNIKSDLKKDYYDPTFHGIDLDARFKVADEKITQATSLGQIFGIIAQTLIELEDSHTFFLPPSRPYTTEYGWQMQMIGDKAYVIAVKPGSDAEAKGLKEGDEVYSIDGVGPTRENMWKIQYSYNALRPRTGMHLQVIKPGGREQEIDVMAKVKQGKQVMDLTGSDLFDLIRKQESESRLHRHRYVELGDELFIWKMPAFDLDDVKVDDMVGKFKKHKALILDLRGNGGGYETTLLRLIANLIDHDVKVADLKRRKENKVITAKSRGDNVFSGKLVVIVDNRSASAAELLSRVVQLEKRGTVIGDRTAGAVMRSKHHGHELGQDTVIFYGASITDADMIMTDGKSLERVGVTPDETKLPTSWDLAAERDPVLAYAAALLGVTLPPEKAGSLFPIEWRK
jgi:carboxyl-terminal processing protease